MTTPPAPTRLDIARSHRNQFLDAAEDAIAEAELLRRRVADLEAELARIKGEKDEGPE